MKSVQFNLKLRKERIYSERIVELGEGVLKYFKKETPKEIRFKANLSDIIFYEKYRNDKSKYKLIINSKTNSFPMIRFKSLSSNDINPLLVFKNQLENFINSEKIIKNKNEKIVMRIAKEESTNINKFDEKQNIENGTFNRTSKILLTKNRNTLNVSNEPESFINLCEKNIDKFNDYQIDSKNFDQIFCLDYKNFKSKNNIEISTTDKNNLSRKLFKLNQNLIGNRNYFNKISYYFENEFYSQTKLQIFLNYCFIFWFFFLFAYNVYLNNYIPILLILTIYSYLKFEFIDHFQFQKVLKTKTSNIYNFLNQNKSNINSYPGKPLYIKSQTNINLNIFIILNQLIDKTNFNRWNNKNLNELDEIEYQYFYNNAEKTLLIAEVIKGELLNIYQLHSNEEYNKTNVIFISIINSEKTNDDYSKVCIYKLKTFVHCLNFYLKNQMYFEYSSEKEIDFKTLELLLKNEEENKKNNNRNNLNIRD